jgi:hypothetical protein
MLSLLMKIRVLFPALLLLLACARLGAAPAPWYQWRSKLDGKLACSQTPLGPGWEKASGPYRDSRCETRSVAR